MAIPRLVKSYNILLFIVASAILITPYHCFARLSNRVKNVRFERQKTEETVKIFFNKLPAMKYFVLHSPERIVIDLKNVVVSEVNIKKKTGGTAVRQVRIGQNRKNITRIVLDIEKNIKYNFKVKKTQYHNRPAIEINVHPAVHNKYPDVQVVSNKLTGHIQNHQIKSYKKHTAMKRRVSVKPDPENSVKPEIEDSVKIEQDGPVKIEPKQSVNPGPGKSVNSEWEQSAKPQPAEMVTLPGDTATDDIFKSADFDTRRSNFAISGFLQIRAGSQIKDDAAVENNTSFRNRMLLKTKYKNMLTLSVLSDYLYFGSEDQTDMYNLNLHEARFRYFNSHCDLSLGKQIIRWGKTDQISPVDTLNPQDLREFIIPEYEERKIPVWMADLKLFSHAFTLEGVFIPFFTPSKINYFKTDWSIFGHVKKEINQSYFYNIKVHKKYPDDEMGFGVRLTKTIKNIDMGISFHHTTEDMPFIESFPVKNINVNGTFSSDNLNSALATAIFTNENIEVEFKKTNIAGFAFETTVSDFGIRGEAAWQENQSFLTSSLTSVRKPTFIYIVGADYTTSGDTYLNLQFLHRHISDYNPEILYFDKNTYTLLGTVSRDVLSDYLKASLKYSTNLNNYSCYFSPQLKYTYFTNLECVIGVAAFFGDDDTWMGRFKDSDIFFLNLSYQF